MNSKVILILILIIALVAGVGVAILFITRQSVPDLPAPTPIASSQPQPAADGPVLNLLMPDDGFKAGEQASLEVFLDTKGKSISGLQFIMNISGSSLPAIVDADSTTDGVQIDFAQIPELSVSTNSVVEQNGTFVIRFAMITQEEISGYSTTGPTQIASIPLTPAATGSIQASFNTQNSRVRIGNGGDEVALTVQDSTYTVTGLSAQSQTDPFLTTETGFGQRGSVTSSQSGLVALASTPTPTATTTVAPYCLVTCVTDSDCAAGLTCEADRCVNPACPTSQTCSCAATATPRPTVTPTASTSGRVATPTPVPTARATATPVLTAAAIPESSDSSEISSDSAEALPTAGSVGYTYLVVGGGALLLLAGAFLGTRRISVEA